MSVYLDDLLVTSPDHRTHKKHLKIIFARLSEYGIIIGPDKCQFRTTELSFLGHHVSAAGISPLASAVDAIVNFVRPEKQRDLRRYLGISPGNEVIVDHWKWTKMLTKVFQWNLTPWGYVNHPMKPHPNPPWGKTRFRVKSKMATIKPVIYVNFKKSLSFEN